jgi:DnaJ-class molecular chaperone
VIKKPVVISTERRCPECKGTGFKTVAHPTRPGVKIYERCEKCLGKGRIAAGHDR